MLVTPKKGTACLTLTLVVDATVMLPLPNVNAYRSNIRSVALGLLGSQPESDRLGAVSRRRMACLMRGHELVSHAEQVPQDIGCDAGQANQHGAVAEIVVGHVVNIGSGCEQFGAVVETDANGKRTRLSRTINGHTCQKFSVNLERGCSVCCALLYAGQSQLIFRTASKSIVLACFFELLIGFGDLPSALDRGFDVRAPGILPIRASPASTSSHARSAADSKSGASTGRTCQPVTCLPNT